MRHPGLQISTSVWTMFQRVTLGVMCLLVLAGTFAMLVVQVKPVEALVSPWSPSSLTKIATRNGVSCAIADGKAYCWGSNQYGQLGSGTTGGEAHLPAPVYAAGVLAGKTVTDIAVGLDGYVCAVADGKAYCWGRNRYGQLGNGTTTDSAVPVAVTASGVLSGRTVTKVATGDGHACVVADGAPYCWGLGGNGRLGHNSTSGSNTPVATSMAGVLSGKTVTDIQAGSSYTCAFASGFYCWGANSQGQLGNASNTDSSLPVTVATGGALAGKTPTALLHGPSAHTACGIASGAAYCWGDGDGYARGDGVTTDSNVPTAVDASGALAGKTLASGSVGTLHGCVLDTAGLAYCWGADYTGTSPTSSSTPVAVDASGTLSGVTLAYIASGDAHCALGTNNRAYCWGDNAYGSLGDNTTTARSQAVRVLFNNKQGNTGYRFYANANSSTPGAPLADTNEVAQLSMAGETFRLRTDIAYNASPAYGSIAAGEEFSCALAVEGPYCWGAGDDGQLGNGTTAYSSSPVPVTTSGVLAGENISAIAAGGWHACVIASGTPYCWGRDGAGQLGDGGSTDQTVPVAVDTTNYLSGKTLTAITAGSEHTCAIADGQAYCWGLNDYGQLGDSSTTDRSTPVPVDVSGVLAGKTLTKIEAGDKYTCALADGAAYCWGRNSNGQLGIGSTSSSNTVPVAVTATGVLAGKTVTGISGGYQHTCVVASGAAYCWGNGANGRLGNASTSSQNNPVAVDTSGVLAGKTVTAVTASGYHTCAVADGQAYCWGQGSESQLGNNTTTSTQSTPVAVTTAGVLSGKAVTGIFAGHYSHTCTIAAGRVYCWGRNATRQLGHATTTNSSVPVTTNVTTNPPAQVGDATYKLQFAEKTATTCAAQSSGFADVTTTSRIAYHTNAGVADGTTISTGSNDPAPSHYTTPQKYVSAPGALAAASNTPSGNVSLWDFSLRENSAAGETNYCLRMTYSDGTPLETATVFPELRTAVGELRLDIVDGTGSSVASPSFALAAATLQTTCQASSGTLGTSSQKLRITNTTTTAIWTVSIAPTAGAGASWNRSDSGAQYDFNDSAGSPAGCASGTDGDGLAGQLTVSPGVQTVTPQSGCTAMGINAGSSSGFDQDTVDAISLMSSSGSTPLNCYWDVTGIGLVQQIPAAQPAGMYGISMTLTVVAQ